MSTYEITKTFTAGPLKGITITERTSARFTVGQTVDKPIGGSPYRIDACFLIMDWGSTVEDYHAELDAADEADATARRMFGGR